MAKSSFSNVQLVSTWREAAEREPKGTRRDVVISLMKEIDMDTEDAELYKKMYNNVTQRKKSLEKRGGGKILFAELAPGARGNRVDQSEIEKLAALMRGDVEETEAEEAEPETAEVAAE